MFKYHTMRIKINTQKCFSSFMANGSKSFQPQSHDEYIKMNSTPAAPAPPPWNHRLYDIPESCDNPTAPDFAAAPIKGHLIRQEHCSTNSDSNIMDNFGGGDERHEYGSTIDSREYNSRSVDLPGEERYSGNGPLARVESLQYQHELFDKQQRWEQEELSRYRNVDLYTF